jgi:hypothetical protein
VVVLTTGLSSCPDACAGGRMLQWRTQDFFGGGGVSTNSVEGRGNGDLGGGSPLVRGSTQYENE